MLERTFRLSIARPFICKACGDEITDSSMVYMLESARVVAFKKGDEVARMALYHEQHAPRADEECP